MAGKTGAAGTKFNTKLAKLRLESNLTMKEISALTGIAPSSLSAWESGSTQTIADRSWDKAVRLADLYGVSATYLRLLVEEAWRDKNQLHAKGTSGKFVKPEPKNDLQLPTMNEKGKILDTKPEFKLTPPLVEFDEFFKQMGDKVKVTKHDDLSESSSTALPTVTVTAYRSGTLYLEVDGLLERVYGKVEFNDFMTIQRLIEEWERA